MLKQLAIVAITAAAFMSGGTLLAQEGHGCCAGKKGADKGHCTGKSQSDAPSISQATVITKAELASLIQEGSVTILDARDAESYEAGHIDGALRYTETALPTDKNSRLVFYCASSRCPSSGKAARKAIELGYTNVMVFKDGWSGWQASL